LADRLRRMKRLGEDDPRAGDWPTVAPHAEVLQRLLEWRRWPGLSGGVKSWRLRPNMWNRARGQRLLIRRPRRARAQRHSRSVASLRRHRTDDAEL